MKKIRIGSGAGYAGDRLKPALDLMEKGNLDYICFECLAERSIALAQKEKAENPDLGYNSLLEYRFEKILPLAAEKRVKVITNMGAANPLSAANRVATMAKEQHITGLKIAAVFGDDLMPEIEKKQDAILWETKKPLRELNGTVLSANIYMGAEGIVEALEDGADIVITGRVSDPALFLAPLIYEFRWKFDDWELLGKGTLVGHLLECGAQVMGGYFADPGKKDVPDIENIGFPIAEVTEDGEFCLMKLPEAGGCITRETCIEQMVYEIHDPTRYLTPNVVADFSKVNFKEIGKDIVRVTGATGHKRPDTLKVSLGYKDCFIGEGEISYGGPGCVERAKLAEKILRTRFAVRNLQLEECKFDYIGMNSTYWNAQRDYKVPEEVRLRVAARAGDKVTAKRIGQEVEALYTNGPAGGCGARQYVREIVSIASLLVERGGIKAQVQCLEV